MKGIIICLFFVGLISALLGLIYLFSLFIFIFGEGGYPGAISRVPGWLFLFSVLILLGRRKEKEVENFFSDIEKKFFL